ncbi:MAG TPA: aminodeoxychorismate synthase component I [Longimicrobium sp.]|nr:aminodeoxychorismate synthase component I [Longimicrobium sp.]
MPQPTSPQPLVRFDSFDAQRGPRSFRFGDFRGVVRADAVDDVLPVLAEVERAVASGLHAAGFVAYEAAPAFDPAFITSRRDAEDAERSSLRSSASLRESSSSGLPLAWFAIYGARQEVSPDDEQAVEGQAELGAWRLDLPESAYHERIARIRELIAAGDTYQVNFTVRLRAPFRGSDIALYERLCRAQRSAFCAFLRLDGASIVSASPELFFRMAGGELELRPMKGTRPRGRWPAEDDALAAELAASPKDRAENLMIVDLLRNDAGRISEFGSVRVERMFEAERYETVHQLTSTIRSRLRTGTTLTDAFRALFPCGSVTGAPKVRTMEIIAELEDAPRGVYTGAIGFASPGEAVFSVAIRTLVLDHAAGTAELGVGSGITFDSDAAAEYRECLDKAAFAHHPPHDFDLLETLLWEREGGWFLLDGHLDRLAASAAYFGFPFYRDAVIQSLADAEETFSGRPMRARLTLARSGLITVHSGPLETVSRRDAEDAEELQFSASSASLRETAVRIGIAAEPVDSRDPLLYHKTTRRDAYERRAASRPDCDDVLLMNERGELTESTIANLVVRLDGVLWTPPLECGLLPGVMRADLLARGEIRERVLYAADLARAEEIWLVNSVRRWRRATLADPQPSPEVGGGWTSNASPGGGAHAAPPSPTQVDP